MKKVLAAAITRPLLAMIMMVHFFSSGSLLLGFHEKMFYEEMRCGK
jgi:hypothetical protein